jgi:hypothetical protein
LQQLQALQEKIVGIAAVAGIAEIAAIAEFLLPNVRQRRGKRFTEIKSRKDIIPIRGIFSANHSIYNYPV